ncbi:MAG TPA: FAD-dependent oxidoreductase, partial [Candidatus Limnocylindrales bacterium]|nr:FAD-dependent oxidoreductase [Candidatus Limnocylindrales bacterium]
LNKHANLEQAAADALTDPRYKKQYHPYGLPKVDSALGMFDCITAPCMTQCAVTQDIPGYIDLLARGEYDKALKVILSRNPLPAITGYMCTHLCETRCTRNNYDEPVAIRALKRFADCAGSVALPVRELSDRKVAVIGGGPAGLAAAYYLALNGIRVTIYEAKKRAGGMLAIAPAFRIPSFAAQKDIDRIMAMGVEIKLSHPITLPPEELLNKGFDAVYIASGFPKDAPLSIEGVEAKGVISALELLEQVAHGERPNLGTKVLVIGGGNTAIDAARSARRLTGEPATIVYRRTEKEMPALKEEREMFFSEGNILEELVSPIRVITKNNSVFGLECVKNRLAEPDADGRRKPVALKGSEFILEADSIVVAIGQQADIAMFDGSAVRLHSEGMIMASPQSGQTDCHSVYAGGDAVRGPATIIQACADGRLAAESICTKFGLNFEMFDAPVNAFSEKEMFDLKRRRARKEVRHSPEMLIDNQNMNDQLVEQTYTKNTALKESTRCLQCAVFCDKCVEVCPNRANYTIMVPPTNLKLPYISCGNGLATVVEGEELFHVQQTRQIIHLDDFCNECGNCTVFCVHQGKPYRDKPRFFLNKCDFEREENNAFHINGNKIFRREGNRESILTMDLGTMTFENEHVRLRLSHNYEISEVVLKSDFSGSLSVKEVVETALIYHGVIELPPFVP